ELRASRQNDRAVQTRWNARLLAETKTWSRMPSRRQYCHLARWARSLRPRLPVAVIDCRATAEALLLRALLESMSAVVTLHQPGTPNDFLLVLGQGSDASAFLVICGHGDENG